MTAGAITRRGAHRLVLLLIAGATLAATRLEPARAGPQRCFGAAARDPARPCTNPALRLAVIPSPRDALIDPSSPCTPVASSEPPAVCAFGTPAAKASATVALVGDSHSVHWRAALEVVARNKAWTGVSIYRSRCPFTTARTNLAGREASQCTAWKQDVLRWFESHPDVHTAFVSHNAGAEVRLRRGEDQFEARVFGYLSAWNSLPRTVEHIFVIRDVPHSRVDTLECVERAMAMRRAPARECAIPRNSALLPDPAVRAADRANTPRVRTIDLTPFMCDRRRCYPVVGGALVHKDVGHMTRVFAGTLGPFLLREVNRLTAREIAQQRELIGRGGGHRTTAVAVARIASSPVCRVTRNEICAAPCVRGPARLTDPALVDQAAVAAFEACVRERAPSTGRTPSRC